ncbi:carbon monoxide dehydrogenase subunit G [Candidatus Thiothrix sp. Deng01]|uniref:Carbon monoxide dehydrogenase subunit G n=1 Tax=Candidatus Thiothrix phosphatis TaxID=3112415 RepID=A0ABU6CXJ9_9GAMM|nr:carbon monoxide dehydrogenase subunit G [Candidatus Thiothrix sp. Deng01]MEB4591551.1 carbon monoxide dehydrogenase subunit G [Candidatus Thiothrix sp. Deng01]
MKMNGEQRIPRDQETVWQALNDLEVIKECVPGCESITTVAENEHELAMTAAVGPVKAKFKGSLQVSDIDAPNSYRMQFQGQGGVAGFAKGEAVVNLTADEADTLLAYTVEAQIGGKLAQVGSRLVDAAAKKMADAFFSRFNAKVAPPEAEA